MTLNDYIKELQELAKDKKLANAELIVSEDDEGNGYRKFSGSPQPVFIEADSDYYIESVYDEDEVKLFEIDAKQVILIG